MDFNVCSILKKFYELGNWPQIITKLPNENINMIFFSHEKLHIQLKEFLNNQIMLN